MNRTGSLLVAVVMSALVLAPATADAQSRGAAATPGKTSKGTATTTRPKTTSAYTNRVTSRAAVRLPQNKTVANKGKAESRAQRGQRATTVASGGRSTSSGTSRDTRRDGRRIDSNARKLSKSKTRHVTFRMDGGRRGG